MIHLFKPFFVFFRALDRIGGTNGTIDVYRHYIKSAAFADAVVEEVASVGGLVGINFDFEPSDCLNHPARPCSAADCAALVAREQPTANGATTVIGGAGACYAEFGMTGATAGSSTAVRGSGLQHHTVCMAVLTRARILDHTDLADLHAGGLGGAAAAGLGRGLRLGGG